MASLAYLPLAFALQSPLWVFFRRMDYRRQRSLQAIQPLVGFVVTVPLAAATDLGVWSLVVGQVAGYVVAVAAALAVAPVPLGPALRPPGGGALPALLGADPGHGGRRDRDRPGPDPGHQAPRRAGGGGLHHPGGHADALHRPRRPDHHRDDLPGDLRDPGPAPRARGAVREVQPRDADVGRCPTRPGSSCSRPTWCSSCSGDLAARRSCCCRAWPSSARSPSWGSTGSRSSAPTATPGRRRWRRRHGDRLRGPGPGSPDCCWTVSTASCSGRSPRRWSALAVRGVYMRRLLPDARYRQLVAPTLLPIALAAAAALALRAGAVGRAPAAGAGDRRAGAVRRRLRVTAVSRERPLLAELLGSAATTAGRAPRIRPRQAMTMSWWLRPVRPLHEPEWIGP